MTRTAAVVGYLLIGVIVMAALVFSDHHGRSHQMFPDPRRTDYLLVLALPAVMLWPMLALVSLAGARRPASRV